MSGLCPQCSATLRWIEMESGKRFPVDPVPTPRTGDIAARPAGAGRTLHYVAGYKVTSARPAREGFVLFTSHYRSGCRMRQPDLRPPSAGPRSVPNPLF